MEMTFVRPANDRAISFAEIAQKTNLDKSGKMTISIFRFLIFEILEVELLVVRAISLNLVKGVIDEVDQKVHMTWVQPRVLNTEQVFLAKIESFFKSFFRLDEWQNDWPPGSMKFQRQKN